MKFRRKPIVFEAEQFIPERTPWPAGVEHTQDIVENGNLFHVATLEGRCIVSPGDWIVTGVKGERWAVKPDIFEATYEKVEK